MKKAQYRQKKTHVDFRLEEDRADFRLLGEETSHFGVAVTILFSWNQHVATSHPEDYSYITSYLLLVGVT